MPGVTSPVLNHAISCFEMYFKRRHPEYLSRIACLDCHSPRDCKALRAEAFRSVSGRSLAGRSKLHAGRGNGTRRLV